jgi:sugar fermentation stimulation protein A
LTPGRLCWLAHRDGPHRKTQFDLVLLAYQGVLVSVDARRPNDLLAEALAARRLAQFAGYSQIEREVGHGASRIDFRLSGAAGTCWVEVKSVTLVEAGVARFPDAPTRRGARHVRELIELAASGDGAAVVFVIQRPDARLFMPHNEADPELADALRRAARAGVGVFGWSCRVGQEQVTIGREVPVVLE